MTTQGTGPDARVMVEARDDEWKVQGTRCTTCRYPVAHRRPWCPVCRGPVTPDEFGPQGSVWSATTQHIAVPGLANGVVFGYVDLDDGPRVLVEIDVEAAKDAGPGTRVELLSPSDEGNPRARRTL